MSDLRYSRFAHTLDVDAFEEAIDFHPLRSEGDEDVGYCVFPQNHTHGDTTGKFSINREKRVYGCWVCGGGSLLSLAMELLGLDEQEATDWVAQFADLEGVDDPLHDLEDEVAAILYEEPPARRVLPYFNQRVIEPYVGRWHPWLDERRIDPSVATTFKVGCNDRARTRDKKTGEVYEGPGVILPLYHEGRLVGWQTRWVGDDLPAWVRRKKYTGTLDFPSGDTLYGYDVCVETNHGPLVDWTFVVEGVATALFLWSAGVPAVATLGGNVSDEQLKLLRRFQNGVVLCPENDYVGRCWIEGKRAPGGRLIRPPLDEYLRDYVPVEVCDPPTHEEGADLGDLAGPKEEPYEALYEHIAENQRPLL